MSRINGYAFCADATRADERRCAGRGVAFQAWQRQAEQGRASEPGSDALLTTEFYSGLLIGTYSVLIAVDMTGGLLYCKDVTRLCWNPVFTPPHFIHINFP